MRKYRACWVRICPCGAFAFPSLLARSFFSFCENWSCATFSISALPIITILDNSVLVNTKFQISLNCQKSLRQNDESRFSAKQRDLRTSDSKILRNGKLICPEKVCAHCGLFLMVWARYNSNIADWHLLCDAVLLRTKQKGCDF